MNVLDASIIGHASQQRDLLHAYQTKRLGQAYLFVGPNGIGKGVVARALAKALVCDNPQDSCAACQQCRQCQMVKDGVHPDVQRFQRDKSQFSAELMRNEVLPWAARKAREGSAKIGLIDDIEHMHRAAANAFLKTLEEPPQGTIWILLCGDLSKAITTIVSRCRVVHFEPLSAKEMDGLVGGPFKETLRLTIEGRTPFQSAELPEEFEAEGEGVQASLSPGEKAFLQYHSLGAPGRLLELSDIDAKSIRDWLVDSVTNPTPGGALAASEFLLNTLSRKSDATQAELRRRLEIVASIAMSVLRDVRELLAPQSDWFVNADRRRAIERISKDADHASASLALEALEGVSAGISRNVSVKIIASRILLEFHGAFRPAVRS